MYLLKNGFVFDIESGQFKQANIVIDHGEIIAINQDQDLLPDTSEKIDVTGKFIIPGLMDMHVHIKHKFAHLFTASGVTTVRNTAGNVTELETLRNASNDEATPRVISADRLIDGPPGLWGDTSPWNVNVATVEEARNEVKRQVAAGADLIKVYGWLSEENMKAVVDEAKLHHLEVSCDLIYAPKVNAVAAANMGIKWNEHASGILQILFPKWSMQAEDAIWNEIDWEKDYVRELEPICQKLIDHGVVICPTLTIYDQLHRTPQVWKPSQDLPESLLNPQTLVEQWNRMASYKEALNKQGKAIPIIKQVVKVYHELGGEIVAGTDTPAGVWTLPGLALHRELQLLVESGLSELEALRCATTQSATSLGLENLGQIKEGFIADLLILNDNPLHDIENTLSINRIIKGGTVYEQQEILDLVPTDEEVQTLMEQFINDFQDGKFIEILGA
jgi:hypothetical protein